MRFTGGALTRCQDMGWFMIVDRFPTLIGIGTCIGAGEEMFIMTPMSHGQGFIADETPAMIPTFDIIATFGFNGADTAMRAFFEGSIGKIFLKTFTDNTEEHVGR